MVAPLVGEEVAHDLPDPGLLDPDVLEDVLMEPHGGAMSTSRVTGATPASTSMRAGQRAACFLLS